MMRNRYLSRYLLTVGHSRAGRLGVFIAREPWEPWFTVAYLERWMGLTGGEYQPVSFPTKWMFNNGRTLWAVFRCYNTSTAAECGQFHDRFNLVRISAQLRAALSRPR